MKQQIPVPAMIAAVVAVVALACFLGFRILGPDRSANPDAPKGPTAEQKARYEEMQNNRNNPGGGRSSTSSPNYPGYPGSGGMSSGGR